MSADSTKPEDVEIDISKLSLGTGQKALAREMAERQGQAMVDGRTLRKKNRTESLNVKVKLETKQRLSRLALGENKNYTDIIEEALGVYEEYLKGELSRK